MGIENLTIRSLTNPAFSSENPTAQDLLYWFPIAALTSYQKFSGLKQHKFIIL